MTAQCLTLSNCSSVRSSTGVRCHAAATRNIGLTARASVTLVWASATAVSDARMSGAGQPRQDAPQRPSQPRWRPLARRRELSGRRRWRPTTAPCMAALQFHEPRLPEHVLPAGIACRVSGRSISARCFCAVSMSAGSRAISSARRSAACLSASRLIWTQPGRARLRRPAGFAGRSDSQTRGVAASPVMTLKPASIATPQARPRKRMRGRRKAKAGACSRARLRSELELRRASLATARKKRRGNLRRRGSETTATSAATATALSAFMASLWAAALRAIGAPVHGSVRASPQATGSGQGSGATV